MYSVFRTSRRKQSHSNKSYPVINLWDDNIPVSLSIFVVVPYYLSLFKITPDERHAVPIHFYTWSGRRSGRVSVVNIGNIEMSRSVRYPPRGGHRLNASGPPPRPRDEVFRRNEKTTRQNEKKEIENPVRHDDDDNTRWTTVGTRRPPTRRL